MYPMNIMYFQYFFKVTLKLPSSVSFVLFRVLHFRHREIIVQSFGSQERNITKGTGET